MEPKFDPINHISDFKKSQAKINKLAGDPINNRIPLVEEIDNMEAQIGLANDDALKEDKIRTRIKELEGELRSLQAQVDTRPLSQSQIQTILQNTDSFLNVTQKGWDSNKHWPKNKGKIQDPTKIDYTNELDITPTKHGEYTLNPETQLLDFEKLTPVIIDPTRESWYTSNIQRHKVAKYIIEKYNKTHYIPGLEYYKWCIENFDKAPASLKVENTFSYFLGSTLRLSDGDACFPCMVSRGSAFGRDAAWLSDWWGSRERVVLFAR